MPIDPQSPVEPGTEAGRTLLSWIRRHDVFVASPLNAVLAIEAEAQSSLLAAVREGVYRVINPTGTLGRGPTRRDAIGTAEARAAVLALLDTLSDESKP